METIEPKVIRRPVRFGGSLPPDQMIQKYHRTDPNWNVPLVEYINADRKDIIAGAGLAIAVIVAICLDFAWLLGWLK